MAAAINDDRQAQIWARLQTVTDPELDEPVTDLKFVTAVEVDADNRVRIGFRLPTYWCAANFSFLMADDMRRAVLELPWVEAVEVTLGEHMYADKINAGLAQGLSFQETFGDEADGDLDEVRRTFLLKAFQRRQAALLAHLLDAGHRPEALVTLRFDDLTQLRFDEAGTTLLGRYLERRAVAAAADEPLAFVDADGDPLHAETLLTYVRALRRVDVNAEFNSALCRGLLHVRFDTETPITPRRTGLADQTSQLSA
ncbi:MAG: iron-sulfur cluster assembly protein [Rhodopseudomonas palustris]|uniref:Iron-sulfur cluster assembly protein n=1 Tax=Rhodopseudomonas palustris TaxID=1076 RepID=A0A933S3G8_RHOPL|nr:iron-sulfur cluster assembly protein [Rhodopseudomonas palustris]